MAEQCSIAGCVKPAVAQGRCLSHYHRDRRTGKIGIVQRNDPGRCTIEGCDRKKIGHGYCAYHWKRWYVWGNPTEPSHRAPDYSAEELRRLHAHLDGVPAGRRAGYKEVENLALILGRGKSALASKLSRMRQARREAARRDGTA